MHCSLIDKRRLPVDLTQACSSFLCGHYLATPLQPSLHTHIITSLHLVTSDQGWSEPHTPAYTCKKGRPSHKRPRLARTIYIYIYMRCLYNYFCRDFMIYTVIYVVYIWFWPTLQMTHLSLRADHEHPLPSHSPSSHASRALPSCCCC